MKRSLLSCRPGNLTVLLFHPFLFYFTTKKNWNQTRRWSGFSHSAMDTNKAKRHSCDLWLLDLYSVTGGRLAQEVGVFSDPGGRRELGTVTLVRQALFQPPAHVSDGSKCAIKNRGCAVFVAQVNVTVATPRHRSPQSQQPLTVVRSREGKGLSLEARERGWWWRWNQYLPL